jgi:hypothetical protein
VAQAVYDERTVACKPHVAPVAAAPDCRTSSGAFVLSVPGEGGPSKVSGQFIVVWKRSGQTWQMHRDIWNTH